MSEHDDPPADRSTRQRFFPNVIRPYPPRMSEVRENDRWNQQRPVERWTEDGESVPPATSRDAG